MEDKKSIAIKKYKERKLSLSKCAELAGMSIEELVMHLSHEKITIFRFKSTDEISKDKENA